MGSVKMQIKNKERVSEQGNVLFLILIAVALFAALSYAVTQSTRSGGGSADREKSILSGASMTQYPSGLRTSVIRMILAGTDVSALKFNSPSNDFDSLGAGSPATYVFHPRGGAALYQTAPNDLMQSGGQGTWYFNANFNVPQIGIDGAGDGNDLIAFLPGVTASICEQVNTEFGINTTGCTMEGRVPELAIAANQAEIRKQMDTVTSYVFSTETGDAETLQGEGGSCAAFTGQPSGCFYDEVGANEYVFYSVLLER